MKITARLARNTLPKLLMAVALLGLQACGGGGGGGNNTGGSSGTPVLTVSPASVVEGDLGATSSLDFSLSLSGAASQDVTVTYSTQDGTATTGDSDYISMSNATRVIPAGQTTATLSITVTGDDTLEFDETLTLQVSATNATLASGSDSVTGTILSDDSVAGYYVSSADTVVNASPSDLSIPAGNLQVIGDMNRLAIIDLTDNLIYIADISSYNNTAGSFSATARIYKDGDYTGDQTEIAGVINADRSLSLTLTAPASGNTGNGDYTATTGSMALGYSAKNSDAPRVFQGGRFVGDIWQDSPPFTAGLTFDSNTKLVAISTSGKVIGVLSDCDTVGSVDLNNVISEQIGRIRSFSAIVDNSCVDSTLVGTALEGYFTTYDSGNGTDDQMLFIWFNNVGAFAINLPKAR